MSLFDVASRIFVADPQRPGDSGVNPASDLIRILVFVWLMLVIGLVGLLLPATAHIVRGHYMEGLIAISTGSFLAAAATAGGSFVGFLFGVPRASQHAMQDSSEPSRSGRMYLPNTNLEQISDWLTKIIVGVGLVEVRAVFGWFDRIGIIAGPAIWQDPAGRIIATAILVHYLLMGFFQGFLVAYLYLPKAFAHARDLEGAEANEPDPGK